MISSLVISLALASLASCHLLPTEKRDICKEEGPESYCASATRARECRRTQFCKIYGDIPTCDRGPAAYCKNKATAIECDKEDYCLTWPADDVIAVKNPIFAAREEQRKYWTKFMKRVLKAANKYMMRATKRYGKYNRRRPGFG